MSDRPRTLVWASSLVVLQTSVEIAYVVGRHEYTPGLRIGLTVVVGLQLLFAHGALRMSAGSVLALMAYEVMAIVAAIGGDGALVIRGALAATAISVMVLLMVSISSFPSPDLPKIT
ncbi:MAG: hypothetical protein QOD38_2093 [Acidimicrobiaceae bacterium]